MTTGSARAAPGRHRAALAASADSHSAPAAPPPPPSAPAAREPGPPWAGAEVHRLSFHGVGGTLFGIHIVNVFLTIVTLGIFYFWGKARVRRYLWSQMAIAGDRFAFHGTGREMLIGFLKAMLLFAVPLIALSILQNSTVGVAASCGCWPISSPT